MWRSWKTRIEELFKILNIINILPLNHKEQFFKSYIWRCVCLFNFIRESINCSLTSRMVSSLTYVSLGQSIVLDTEKAFLIVCQIILNWNMLIKNIIVLVYLSITFRKPYRQHSNLPNYMQLRLKSFRYSSRKMKVLIYKLLNFKNLVSVPFVLTNYFWEEYQGLKYSRFLFVGG